MLKLVHNEPYTPEDVNLLARLRQYELLDVWLSNGLVTQDDIWIASALSQAWLPTWKPRIIHSESDGIRTLRRNMKCWDKKQKRLSNNRNKRR